MRTIITFFIIFQLFREPVNAQVSTEVNTGSKRVDLILDISCHIDPQKKWSIYTHNLAAFHHHGNTGFLTFNKLSYTFKPGIGISANFVGNFSKFYPTAGVHYDKKTDLLHIFLLSTYAFDKSVHFENFFILVYRYPLNKDLYLFSQGEFYTRLLKWSNDESLQRIKFGIEFHNTRSGFFYESIQNGRKINFRSVNLGVCIKQTF